MSTCVDYRRHAASLTRRSLLRFGALAMTGIGLPAILKAASEGKRLAGRAKSVIFLHQYGGPPPQETFDLKPHAPEGIRGLYPPIRTSLAGVQACELLPRMAKVMHKVTVLRSLHHEMKNHNSAGYYSLTGYPPPTDDQRLRDSIDLAPAYGSVVDRLAPAGDGMPTFVAFPHVIRDGSITPGQHASFLGKKHDPLFFANDPNDPGFRLPELSLPRNLSLDRLANRREVLRIIDDQAELSQLAGLARDIDAHHQRALSLLTSPRVKKAFDLASEPAALREKYGRTTYGQGCLLARRLVEAGVRFVNVYFAQFIGGGGNSEGWDVHGNNRKAMGPILKEYLLPITDQTLPTLINDLDERGLLDETLVVWVGEFGRTPKINANAGRDHWPQCYCAVLAGGGVRRGHVVGGSDQRGAYPASDACRPEDLAATMFHLLGIDPGTEIFDALQRPLPIARGTVIASALA